MAESSSAKVTDDEESAFDRSDELELEEEVATPRPPQLKRLGRYRLVREIASGGMASVNLAVTEGLDKLVALKMIHPHLAQEEAFVRMFLDEARIASSISHRNVCNTFDFGEADGRYFIAMDFLSGQSLRDVFLKLRRFPSEAEPKKLAAYMAYIIAEACEGLHAAHQLRNASGELLHVVHRDVSPHNLFVTYDGNISVVDFGIARASDRLQHTATGVLKGKFSYMAPEQVRQSDVDRRADIWSLGVCLWESLILERLFVRSSHADTLMSVMMDRVRPPTEIKPDLPKGLDAIIAKALARNPRERYATAREMGRDLMQVVRDTGIQVGPVEIEQWLERLFYREREAARELARQAKQAALDSSWAEGTPSLNAPRAMLRSGPMLKAPPMATHSHPAVLIQSGMIPHVPAANTGEACSDDRAAKRKVRRAAVAAGAFGLCAALSWGYWFTRPDASRTKVEALSVAPEVPSVSPPAIGLVVDAPVAIVTAAEPTEPQAAAPIEDKDTPSPRPAVAPLNKGKPVAAVGALPQVATTKVPARVSSGPAPIQADKAPEPAVRDDVGPHAVKSQAPESGSDTTALAHESDGRAVDGPVSKPARAPVPSVQTVPSTGPSTKQSFAAQASFDELEVDGSLGSGIVARTLGRSAPLVRTCYGSAAQRAGKNDFSPLRVSFSIDEMGALRNVESSSHSLPGLARCVQDALKRLRSDRKPDIGTVRVRLQISFRPQ